MIIPVCCATCIHYDGTACTRDGKRPDEKRRVETSWES